MGEGDRGSMGNSFSILLVCVIDVRDRANHIWPKHQGHHALGADNAVLRLDGTHYTEAPGHADLKASTEVVFISHSITISGHVAHIIPRSSFHHVLIPSMFHPTTLKIGEGAELVWPLNFLRWYYPS